MATSPFYNTQESQVYENGRPVATGCSIRERLTQQVLERTFSKSEALRKFEAVMLRFPSGTTQVHGVELVKSASNELTLARKEMTRAYTRLADYLDRGVVPEDLKETRKASA